MDYLENWDCLESYYLFNLYVYAYEKKKYYCLNVM